MAPVWGIKKNPKHKRARVYHGFKYYCKTKASLNQSILQQKYFGKVWIFFFSSILYQKLKEEKPFPHFCHTTKIRISFVITLKVQKLQLKTPLIGKHSLPSNTNFVGSIKLTTYTLCISFPCQKGLNIFVVNSKFAYCKRYNANQNSPTHFPGNKSSPKEQQEVSFLLQYPDRVFPVALNSHKSQHSLRAASQHQPFMLALKCLITNEISTKQKISVDMDTKL